ncbi:MULTISPECIES: antibiotic biosynthesis monooxygenase [unclassified Leucobacter]|uniref:antibiotic biosynthesis monooxygenase n=1 Tax=unclassified Leucobacter TaxID=2621730 RepID=UPI000AE37E07|nr:antibiotic biosynthesis monooxygenase [Leucobacter sp. Ag1]
MSSPVTVMVRRETAETRVDEVLAWLDQGLLLARDFEGYLGGGVLRDASRKNVLITVYAFADRRSLERWNHSEQWHGWTRDGAPLARVADVQKRTGLEGWFAEIHDVPGRDPNRGRPGSAIASATPPRWKQAAAIWCGMLPLNIGVTSVATQLPWWGHLPIAVRSLLLVSSLVPLMTFVVMPAVTRVLRPWLRRDPALARNEQLLRDALDSLGSAGSPRGGERG